MSATDRRVGALLGLAAGDAAGWPAVRHRAHLLPAWTRRLHRDLDAFAETEQVTTLPVPFSLNQPTEPLRLGPGDDAEWAAWTASRLLDAAESAGGVDRVRRADVHGWWRSAATAATVPRGRISVATAVGNLTRGIDPPHTGHDNPHHFDDAAAVRAVALAAGSATPDEAVRLAGWDAEVTNADDGVAAARAVAVTLARLIGGDDMTKAWTDGAAQLPPDGLAARTVQRARQAGATASRPADAVAELDSVVDHVYSYGVAAAQTLAVAVTLAEAAHRGGAAPIEAITAAVCLPALADSAPALTGALVGAASGASSLPSAWTQRCRYVAGCCSAELAGTDLFDIAARLDAASTRKDHS
ncbi:ADP-ribosylglycohydrolase [Haloactinopolyspora alba]|uniref:ADP-ribosylglycohydrolase n=1 Tax=Haloactinopolyspora alba TaxID=648780 RepID=A0A2P8E9I8_9ACTN|nr:ADP-ribosylglycohydrolase family protein [Haloactinopolyspora alba]PSL06142.1 ADP-ribosylglycohydrolase [Haloactinopolyspora alba]